MPCFAFIYNGQNWNIAEYGVKYHNHNPFSLTYYWYTYSSTIEFHAKLVVSRYILIYMKIKKIIYESSVIKLISYFPIDTISIFQFWYVSFEIVLDVFYEAVTGVLYEVVSDFLYEMVLDVFYEAVWGVLCEVVSDVLYEVILDVFHERSFHDSATSIWRTPYRYDSLAVALKFNIYMTRTIKYILKFVIIVNCFSNLCIPVMFVYM